MGLEPGLGTRSCTKTRECHREGVLEVVLRLPKGMSSLRGQREEGTEGKTADPS